MKKEERERREREHIARSLICLGRVGPVLIPRLHSLRAVIEANLLKTVRVDVFQQHARYVHERRPPRRLVPPGPLHQLVQQLGTVLRPFHHTSLDHVSQHLEEESW